MDWGAWWAAVHGVAKSWPWLSDFTFTFHFHTLEKEMATHSSVLAWRIPGTGEPGGLPSMGSHRVGHDWSDLAVAVAVGLLEFRSGTACGQRNANLGKTYILVRFPPFCSDNLPDPYNHSDHYCPQLVAIWIKIPSRLFGGQSSSL